jgi:NAD-dependent SIR2 family protein deacetylase
METYYQNEITLAEKVANPLSNDCPYTLFLGAGASVSSGIPSAKMMIRDWQGLLYKEQRNLNRIIDEDFQEWLKHEYPEWRKKKGSQYAESDYSLLFSHFYQQPKERQLYIERELEGKKPAFGYLHLAGLIAANRFNRILTSNFDDLLHDALMKYYDIKPIVCAFDSVVSKIRINSQRPKIIKLHGDFLFDNIRTMRHELKGLDTNMEGKMYEMCKDAGLIVVGYSGSDEAVMAPIRDMIRKPDYLNMGVHWCIHKPKGGDDEGSELPPKLQDIKYNYEDRVNIYYIESFDRLVKEMFIACNCELPSGYRERKVEDQGVDITKPVKTILFLSANPKTTPSLRLDEEIRDIKESLRGARNRNRFEIKTNEAVRSRDFRRALLDYQPQIVQFTGHGTKEGLMVEDEIGFPKRFTAKALSGLFELCSNHVECVVLNACYSAPQAKAISKHIKYVIGMRKEILDKAAREFSIGFYDALGADRSIPDAFEFGRNALLIEFPDISEHLIPLLLC